MTHGRTYAHPDVFDRGVREGWADPETDPSRIDWAARQHVATIPFKVVGGRPVSPGPKTGIEHGRGEMGHWERSRPPTPSSSPASVAAGGS